MIFDLTIKTFGPQRIVKPNLDCTSKGGSITGIATQNQFRLAFSTRKMCFVKKKKGKGVLLEGKVRLPVLRYSTLNIKTANFLKIALKVLIMFKPASVSLNRTSTVLENESK